MSYMKRLLDDLEEFGDELIEELGEGRLSYGEILNRMDANTLNTKIEELRARRELQRGLLDFQRELNFQEETSWKIQARIRSGLVGIRMGRLLGSLIARILGRRKPRRVRPAGTRAVQRAERLLDWVSAFVPKRVSNEEIGDALEFINRMAKAGRSKWIIYAKVVSTAFWVMVHTGLHYAQVAANIVGASRGKGD